MTIENPTMSAFLRRTAVNYILNQYGEKLNKLFIGQSIQNLIESLGDEALTDLATGDTPVHELVGTFPKPETKSKVYRIFEIYPNIAEVYQDIDVFNLPENQLERLARGDNPIEVLGKPERFYPIPPFTTPKICNTHLTDGSPRTAYTNDSGTRKSNHISEKGC